MLKNAQKDFGSLLRKKKSLNVGRNKRIDDFFSFIKTLELLILIQLVYAPRNAFNGVDEFKSLISKIHRPDFFSLCAFH